MHHSCDNLPAILQRILYRKIIIISIVYICRASHHPFKYFFRGRRQKGLRHQAPGELHAPCARAQLSLHFCRAQQALYTPTYFLLGVAGGIHLNENFAAGLWNVLFLCRCSPLLLSNCTMNRTHHINIQFFFIKDRISSGEIELEYCLTNQMVGDYFTKPLQGAAFFVFRKIIMGENVA